MFLEFYGSFHESSVECSKHVVTNLRAYPEPDGLVRIDSYFQTSLFEAHRTRIVIGQYSDSLRECPDGLRLAHKRVNVERQIILPPSSADWVGV
jgi:3-phenylpropionate/cinnamic acid dioxygenase small subunit